MLNFNNITRPAAPTAAAPAQRATPKVYLNVGVNVPVPQADGTVEDVFVSIPMGIAIDTMEEMEIKGKSTDWHNMVQTKNYILSELKKAAEGIPEGGELLIPDGQLQLQLKRVGTPAAPAAGENPMLAAISERFAVAAE